MWLRKTNRVRLCLNAKIVFYYWNRYICQDECSPPNRCWFPTRHQMATDGVVFSFPKRCETVQTNSTVFHAVFIFWILRAFEILNAQESWASEMLTDVARCNNSHPSRETRVKWLLFCLSNLDLEKCNVFAVSQFSIICLKFFFHDCFANFSRMYLRIMGICLSKISVRSYRSFGIFLFKVRWFCLRELTFWKFRLHSCNWFDSQNLVFLNHQCLKYSQPKCSNFPTTYIEIILFVLAITKATEKLLIVF